MHESGAPDREQSTRTEVYPTGSGEPDRGQGVRWGRRTRCGTVHPMGSSTPDRGRRTRWGAVHPDRTGAMHTDRVSRPHQQAQPRHTVACRSTHAARRDTRNRCGWLDSLRCVRVRWLVGYRRGSRCVRVRCRALPARAGWIGGGAAYVTSSVVGYRRRLRGCACVSRRLRPCRCRNGCRETRASGGPGRWPLRR